MLGLVSHSRGLLGLLKIFPSQLTHSLSLPTEFKITEFNPRQVTKVNKRLRRIPNT